MTRARHLIVGGALVALGFAGGALAGPKEYVGKLNGALKHLQAAEMTLDEARDELGGHRAKAVEHIHEAQAELQQAVAYANAH